MKIDDVVARPDLIGRRVSIRWMISPEGPETVADAPRVTIRRKLRDFTFPSVVVPDPFLIYDSESFPPPAIPGLVEVHDLPDREFQAGVYRVRETTITVAELVGGQRREIIRRTVRTVYAADRRALRQEVELLDVGGPSTELTPGVVYYYELDSPVIAPEVDRSAYRVSARPGDVHGSNRTLYNLLPGVYRRHDTIARRVDAGTGLIPEASANGGQLRRLVDVFGTGLDAIRSSADGLWTAHDPERAEPKFLGHLATWIGWDLTASADIAWQRNEIRDAPRLYGAVGSVPGLCVTVDHYTGWSTRIAEFVQHITVTNLAPQLNVFGLVDRAGAWWGIGDAAPILGFAPPNAVADGSIGVAATLTGAVPEPFALERGMSLTIVIDGGLPETVTFAAADFAQIEGATAAEVARVIGRAMSDLRAEAVAGTLRVTSHREDIGSRIEVVPAGPTLVSIDGAPGGRVDLLEDAQQRTWLAYATTVRPGEQVRARILTKARLRGSWYDAQPMDPEPLADQADPAVVELPGSMLWLAWIEHPGTAHARIRWRRGSPQPLSPARLLGEFAGPFNLTAGTTLQLTGFGATATFVVQAADYASLTAATAAEVAVAINTQIGGVVVASVAADGSIALRTAAVGPGVNLLAVLSGSTAARALGFGERTQVGRGSWKAAVTWDPSGGLPAVTEGRHAACTAVRDPEGAVRLFWSTHRRRRWRIARARWDDRVLVATGGGVGVRGPGGPLPSVTMASGLPSDDVRGVAVDADGSTWYATAAGGAVRRPDGTFTILSVATTGPNGLASDDVRGVAVAPDGGAWFAHAAGVSVLDAGGTWQTITAAPGGLAANDCRAVLATTTDTIWVATSAGLSSRDPGGTWRSWTQTDGLPSADIRHATEAFDGVIWIATAAGLAALGKDGISSQSLEAAGGPPGTDDIRAVAAGAPANGSEERPPTVWAATAGGLVQVRSPRHVTTFGMADGLPSNDCRSALVGPDDEIWVGTPAGAAVRQPGGSWLHVDMLGGLPSNDVRAFHGPWSAALEFLPAGAGDREPHAVTDATGRIWLSWAEIQATGDVTDGSLIRTRRFTWPGPAWGGPIPVTSLGGLVHASDREPTLFPIAAGGARVSFRSDRDGGHRIWSVDLDAADVPGASVPETTGPSSDHDPTTALIGGVSRWLLFRSDRNVAIARLGANVADGSSIEPSRRAPTEASIRRYSGSTTVWLDDLTRNRERRRFGDLSSYTPQKPRASGEAPLEPDELYTRGTIGLYVERGPAGRPLTAGDADRLRQLLARFLPVNLRAVIILRPSPALLEQMFPVSDAFQDQHPFIEFYSGIADSTAAALPDLLLFISTDAASITVDPGMPTTLRRRLWWPAPQ
jgi:phage tail-like protein